MLLYFCYWLLNCIVVYSRVLKDVVLSMKGCGRGSRRWFGWGVCLVFVCVKMEVEDIVGVLWL